MDEMNAVVAIFKSAAPLIFAMLGALLTEYTGALAVFMEGAIMLSGFICALCIISTGSFLLSFVCSTTFVMIVVGVSSALFVQRWKANPFLVGLSLNLFAQGVCSIYVSHFSSGSHTIAFSSFEASKYLSPSSSYLPSLIGVLFTAGLFFFVNYTSYGIRLRYVGKSEEVLRLNGSNCCLYKVASWVGAAFFASCAGNALVFRLAAYAPSMGMGKGWIGILSVFLGMKKPYLCLVAVFMFTASEYATGILQARLSISPTLLLSFPYIFSFVVYTIYQVMYKSEKKL